MLKECNMATFFREGGFAMFFLVAFGVATLVASTLYAWRVTRVALRVTLGLGTATWFTTLMGVCVDLAAVGHGALDYQARHHEPLVGVLLGGLAESLAPGVLGFSFLALAALIATLGLYREPES
jgi:hypothetical protein